jgi:S-DNA-T family DNA segregation ATPase FtsK/SpoIIIE
MMFWPSKYQLKANNYIGFLGFLFTFAGLLAITIPQSEALATANAGKGGGMVGYLISFILLKFLNVPASAVILIAFLVIFLITAANARVTDIVKQFIGIFRKPAPDAELQINEPDGGLVMNTRLPIKGTIGSAKATTKEKPEEGALTVDADPDWVAPSLELLSATTTKPDAGNIKERADIIQNTLGSFGIEVKMGEVNVGPTVSQYTFKPPNGVKLNKITALEHNVALSLAAHPIRIEAPIPGRDVVGIEVPNKSTAIVRLREILASPEMQNNKSPLAFVLGRDVSGQAAIADLAKMPHMLVAGATGTGKSVMINSFLTSLLIRNSPATLKLILVDPKQVELARYNDIPHLLAPVITDDEKTISALKWTVAEMQRRYKLLREVGKVNINEYNAIKSEEAMPYIVMVIDEMAQLMGSAGKDAENLIVQLAQLSRAVGIHLVLATQRPSVNVITGLIKANIPARIAFTVPSLVDSRTILDQAGADKLLGKGDMLYASPEFMKPKRIQGALIETKETEKLTAYLKGVREPQYNEEVLTQSVRLGGHGGGGGGDFGGGDDDELFNEAADTVIRSGKASASLLQRRLRVGYARAARLLDLLEERGIVGPADGARPRDVLVSSMTDLGPAEDE